MVRFGIIGCGVIAPRHAEAIREAQGAQLVAVCDIIEDKAKQFQEKYGAPKMYVDYHEMLRDVDIDAVCICTPSGMHGEMAQQAALAGKHILREKPMEITDEKMNRLIEAVEKTGVKMGCVFQRRFQPIPVQVKKALESGVFGKVLVADAYLKYYRSREYYKSAGWRATWEYDGGGALMNQGVHGIDLISWFMGGIKNVRSVVKTQFHDIVVEDTALAIVEYNNGAVGVIEGTTCVNPAQDTRFEIHCENGSIIFSDAGLIQWNINGEENPPLIEDKDAVSAKADPTALARLSHLPLVEDLVRAIETDGKPAITPREARKAVDTILAIYQSSKENRQIDL